MGGAVKPAIILENLGLGLVSFPVPEQLGGYLSVLTPSLQLLAQDSRAFSMAVFSHSLNPSAASTGSGVAGV